MENNVVGEVGFVFSSRFSQLIGRQLISNPIVAVSELVKNAYDADADNITVEFQQLCSNAPCLKIVDDGEGMTFFDIKSKWMMVGTDNKVHAPFTPKGRRKLGEKGIGRFSVERLAKKVKIISTRKGDDFSISFTINWDDYEKSAEEFSDLKHTVIREPCNSETHGTTLFLEGLRDTWGKDELLNLQKELELLRPLDINEVAYKKYDFAGQKVKINLVAPDYLPNKRTIKTTILTYAQAHLYGEIKEDGSVIIRVFIKSNISASKTDISREYTFNPGEYNTSCGPVTYEAFIFLKDKRLYKSLDIGSKEVDDYLKTFCGMKIYRDGFRILPFGDADNDWLELNAARTSSPEFRIATYNTIGLVYITRDENPGLQDVLSRENMYDTPEFISLKNFVNDAFNRYTSIQLDSRKKKERKVKEEGQLALEGAQKALSTLAFHLTALKDSVAEADMTSMSAHKEGQYVAVQQQAATVVSSAQQTIEQLRNAYRFYKKQTDFRSREMQIYRNIATLGISAAMFGHEALNQTAEAKAILNEVFADYPTLISTTDDFLQLLTDLKEDLTLIDEKADFFRNYLQREKQDQSQYINVYSVLLKLLKQHENAFTAINVIPSVKISGDESDYFLWAYEGDIESIFANLITNAYKALKRTHGKKEFRFELNLSEGVFHIHAINDGQPIKKENRSKIFEPLFSTYSDGTGLGLTIIQDTLFLYQGTIKLSDDYPITHFELLIPKNEAPKENV